MLINGGTNQRGCFTGCNVCGAGPSSKRCLKPSCAISSYSSTARQAELIPQMAVPRCFMLSASRKGGTQVFGSSSRNVSDDKIMRPSTARRLSARTPESTDDPICSVEAESNGIGTVDNMALRDGQGQFQRRKAAACATVASARFGNGHRPVIQHHPASPATSMDSFTGFCGDATIAPVGNTEKQARAASRLCMHL